MLNHRLPIIDNVSIIDKALIKAYCGFWMKWESGKREIGFKIASGWQLIA